jgi:molybdopterin-guanine dinucleotide biosynthesis protein A
MLRDDLTGFVLAGGKSTRMGRDKAMLALRGRTLLETSLAALRQVAPEVFILGPTDLYGSFAATIPDIFPGCGPLSGIHSALCRTATQFNLIVAVDIPFVGAEFLAYLAGRATGSSAMVTLPEIGGYLEPVCAVYSREFRMIAEQALRRGEHKITPLFSDIETLVIPQPELEKFAFTAEMFENLNTPEDLERARSDSAHRSE